METTQKQKVGVTAEKFEVKVESEAAHLMYLNNMSKEKADKVAREVISQSYEVVTEGSVKRDK